VFDLWSLPDEAYGSLADFAIPKPRKDFLAHSTVKKRTLRSRLRRFREVRIRISGKQFHHVSLCRNKKQIFAHVASWHET
jgi:hypothetical protein